MFKNSDHVSHLRRDTDFYKFLIGKFIQENVRQPYKVYFELGTFRKRIKTYGTKYSRMDQVKLFKGCLPQISLDPFLNTLSHMIKEPYIQEESQL